MKTLFFIGFLLWSFPAFAQGDGLPPECRFLPGHIPDDGVAFRPGVDVRGKAVVPADLNARPAPGPTVMRVPLSVDLIERLRNTGGGAPQRYEGLLGEAALGLLEIHPDGRVLLNGEDWSDPVYAACGQAADNTISLPVSSGVRPPAADAPAPIVPEGTDGDLLEGGESRAEDYK